MKKYRKKQLIEFVARMRNGNVLVQNEGMPEDRWEIPFEVFAATYEEVPEDEINT